MADDTLVKTIEIHNVRVDGYDAQHWRDSYNLLRDAIVESLGEFVQDDDVAEEAILCKAVETAAAGIKLVAALRRLDELVHDGDMPAIGGIVQHDLVSRSYVRLATAVEREAEDAELHRFPEPVGSGT